MRLDLQISLILALLIGCTDASEFGGKANNLGGIKDEASEEEEENEPISEPSEVAGAFLYCAFWNDDQEIKGKAAAAANIEKSSTRSVLNGPEIGCGMYKADFPHDKVEDDDLIVEWAIMSNDKEYSAATVKQEFDHNFHTIVKVPIDKTGGAIVAKYRSSKSHLPGYRLKDIASITESGANDPDFDIKRALSKDRSKASQMHLAPPAEITAAGQKKGCDTKCATLIGLGIGVVAAVIQPAAAPEIQRNISASSNSTSHDGNHRYREIRKKTTDGRIITRGIQRTRPVYPVDRQGREYGKPQYPAKNTETQETDNTGNGGYGDSETKPNQDQDNTNTTDNDSFDQKPASNPWGNIGGNPLGSEAGNNDETEKPQESKYPAPKQKENVVGESKLVEPIEHARSSDNSGSVNYPNNAPSTNSGASTGTSTAPQSDGAGSE